MNEAKEKQKFTFPYSVVSIFLSHFTPSTTGLKIDVKSARFSSIKCEFREQRKYLFIF